MVYFRWIDKKEELERLYPIFENFGWTNLNPYFSKALIAEDEDGNIIGFNALQMVARPEPLWVSPKYRGKKNGLTQDLAKEMASYLNSTGCPYWVIKTESPFVMELCEENGMARSSESFYEGGV